MLPPCAAALLPRRLLSLLLHALCRLSRPRCTMPRRRTAPAAAPPCGPHPLLPGFPPLPRPPQVVYVVLEAQYQASLSAAVNKINTHRKEVCVELVGYLLEELRDAKNFENFKKDVASGGRGGCVWAGGGSWASAAVGRLGGQLGHRPALRLEGGAPGRCRGCGGRAPAWASRRPRSPADAVLRPCLPPSPPLPSAQPTSSSAR